jgi:hypothetical protein
MAIVGKFDHGEGYTIPVQYIWPFLRPSFDSSNRIVFFEPYYLIV